MRPSGTPRDLVTAVPCPAQLPDGATAAWLTGVLYAGAQLGCAHGLARPWRPAAAGSHKQQRATAGTR